MLHHLDVFLIEHCPVLLLLVNMALECQKEAGAATQAVLLTWCLSPPLGTVMRSSVMQTKKSIYSVLVLLVH